MVPCNTVIIIGLIYCFVCTTYSSSCEKTPYGVVRPKNINDIDRYIITIEGNPKTYTPNQKYNVSLRINPDAKPQKAFIGFMLTSEPLSENTNTGQFQIRNDLEALTKFNELCPNTVVENSKLPKTKIQVYWIAPPKNSGCLAIVATVIESRENWFSEDGQLTKKLCEDSETDENDQPPRLTRCCACDEAKYEVAFEGKWTRNTHPKNYPSNVWSTKFSNIIGASHQRLHSFWNEQDVASDGLKELADSGNTEILETELKEQSEHIRTIIKARGLQHPNITQTSYAVFRVDNKNHRVSLVSKIMPSPDWIVGVSNFELCKEDCTWVESYTFNLYPIDAGTNDGIDYTSSVPLYERRQIQRITENHPNDQNSPFYSEDGEKMNPVAKLHFTRQRLYEKPCDNIEDNDPEEQEACATTDWSDWLPCSARCGVGKTIRTRNYVRLSNEDNCSEKLFEERTCYGNSRNCDWNEYHISPEKTEETTTEKESPEATLSPDDDRCEVGKWSEWSSCSATCGTGTKTRDRELKNAANEEICSGVLLQENENCTREQQDCENSQTESDCPGSNWGPWSKCNVTVCGTGYKTRIRLPTEDSNKVEDDSETTCSNQEVVECNVTCSGEEASEHFALSQIIEQAPDGPVINCKVSRWSIWSKCDASGATCGWGHKSRVRQILRHPENGGRACPRKLFNRTKCWVPCVEKSTEKSEEVHGEVSDLLKDLSECLMGRWSGWTPCSSICGPTAMRLRTREIIYQPPGVTCPPRLEKQRCNLPLACTESRRPIYK